MFDQSTGLRYAPIVIVNCGFVVCTTHLLALVQADAARQDTVRENARQAFQTCMRLLQKIGPPFRASLQFADMLQRMMDEWVMPESDQLGVDQKQSVEQQVRLLGLLGLIPD
jgi:hypothetical protein